jgi:hypothetical protein
MKNLNNAEKKFESFRKAGINKKIERLKTIL